MKYLKMMLILLVSVFALTSAQAQVVLKARIGGHDRDHRHIRHHHYYWRHHHRYDHWY